ncbi:hypothetical protein QUF84_21565 [Fictibacillus enclensis]|uniref:Uncharacterized protein n=1 Tax=Fictibacillus solisalsi TaxID=459525 RepID=A0A1G9XJJ6_9BACL|nr:MULTISPECIES: hypothetical protein [Fictibacillus]MDM5339787.1 hypothetical protein [Fictibacillus enclensis]WHY71323.1 hypothetical protein QNH15_20265 [Fictibacillus enclensis]SCC13890.1 hypothetical protein GA0061096_2579 [Fictibacillus enclensis]SDM96576.1 hypothetical protein SAMN04488137_2822 [Fictibacillus solisalsi]
MKYCKDCLTILHHDHGSEGCPVCEGTNTQDIVITVLSNERNKQGA